jgi:hypothetical protein
LRRRLEAGDGSEREHDDHVERRGPDRQRGPGCLGDPREVS